MDPASRIPRTGVSSEEVLDLEAVGSDKVVEQLWLYPATTAVC
jgi:hypothetical protein